MRCVFGALRSFSPLFKCFLIVALFGLLGGLSEIGFTQRKPTPTPTPQQFNATKQISSSRKKAGKAAVQSTVVTQPPPAKPDWPSKFTIMADKTSVHQGESVNFTLDPAPPADFPFKFVFDFQDEDADAVPYYPSGTSHRFLKPGPHDVSAKPIRLDEGVAGRISVPAPTPTIEMRPIVVQETPLTMNPSKGGNGPPFVVGQKISFSIEALDDQVRYRLFIDGKPSGPAQASASFLRDYETPGEHRVWVELQFTSDDHPRAVPSETKTFAVESLPSDAVDFTRDPPIQEVNREIKFTAALKSNRIADLQLNRQALEYRFVYDDGQPSDWSKESTAVHSYREARTYQPHVEVRVNDGRKQIPLVSSEPLMVTISSPSLIDPKIYLLIGGGAIILGGGALLLFFSYKLLRGIWHGPSASGPNPMPNPMPSPQPPSPTPPPHPTIILHSERNPAQVEKPRVSLGLQVRFKSGTATSKSSLISAESRLIRSERRRNV